MRTSSLARVVVASLGVSVVVTLGCVPPPPAPSPAATPTPIPEPLSVSISPTGGPSAGATVATISRTGPGTGFQSGATVTVDGSRVDATVLSANTISLVMPAHAAGSAKVTVTNPPGQTLFSVWYSYVPPMVISELLPNSGSTAGGTPLAILGPNLCCLDVTVTVDGIVHEVESGWPENSVGLTTPAHAAGPVEVIVTDRYGQAASAVFTYALPATFDLNGDWQGWARLDGNVPSDVGARLVLTIRDNIGVSVSCRVCQPGENCALVSAPSLALDPPSVVANGEFSFVGSGGVSVSGKILSPIYATGSINTPSCGSRYWWAWAQKKQ